MGTDEIVNPASVCAILMLLSGTAASSAAAPPATNRSATIIGVQSVAHDASAARGRSRGIGWTDYLTTYNASVTVVKRSAPGRAEVHRNRTDVWHVIEGTATLVTGGSMVGAAETEPGELRASSVSGGRISQVGPGDLVIIPAGVPHWVKAVAGKQFVYLVVKIPPDAPR